MSEQINSHERLTNVEERLTRLESLLVSINEKLEQRSDVGEVDTEKAEEFRQWVTNYVSMRLQQLVPETCDHPDEAALQTVPSLITPQCLVQRKSSTGSSGYQFHLSARWLSNVSLKMHDKPALNVWILTFRGSGRHFDNAKPQRSFPLPNFDWKDFLKAPL